MTTRPPGGAVLLRRDAPRDLWLAERRKHMCATDVAKALGKTTWGDGYSVWCEKNDFVVDDDPTQSQLYGQVMEPGALKLWRLCHPDAKHVTNIRNAGLMASRAWPIAAATVDRTARCPEGRCVLEIKTDQGPEIYKRWGNEANPLVPAQYIYQGQWQLFVTGRDHVHYPVLHGRNALSRTVYRDQELIDYLVGQMEVWWQKHIVEGVMPDATAKSRELINGRWATPETRTWVMDDDSATLLQNARWARNDADAAVALADSYEASFLARMGDATHAQFSDGTPAATWIPTRRIAGADEKWARTHATLWEKYSQPDVVRKFNPDAVRADYPKGDLPDGLRFVRKVDFNPPPEAGNDTNDEH
jgi:putative phage-type endonuclease